MAITLSVLVGFKNLISPYTKNMLKDIWGTKKEVLMIININIQKNTKAFDLERVRRSSEMASGNG